MCYVYKFLGCHGFGLFLCQAMALVVFSEKKIRKKNHPITLLDSKYLTEKR